MAMHIFSAFLWDPEVLEIPFHGVLLAAPKLFTLEYV